MLSALRFMLSCSSGRPCTCVHLRGYSVAKFTVLVHTCNHASWSWTYVDAGKRKFIVEFEGSFMSALAGCGFFVWS